MTEYFLIKWAFWSDYLEIIALYVLNNYLLSLEKPSKDLVKSLSHFINELID